MIKINGSVIIWNGGKPLRADNIFSNALPTWYPVSVDEYFDLLSETVRNIVESGREWTNRKYGTEAMGL